MVHGAGVDELPLDGTGVLYEVTDAGVEHRFVDAVALGLKATATSKLAGGDAATNARYVEAVLRGEPGSRRDVVLLNAGAAFLASGTVDTLEAGIDRAALTIDAGLSAELLGRLRAERTAAEQAVAADATGPGGSARVTVAPARATRGRNVVAEIADRRRADLAATLDAGGPSPTELEAAGTRRGPSSNASPRRVCT